MNLISAYRANQILYNFLLSNDMSGKTILVPANICKDVVETLQMANMQIIFADIDSHTLCLSEKDIYINLKNIDIVLFVHTYGFIGEFSHLFAELKSIKPSVIIVDDRCLCLPDTEATNQSLADLILYSFGAKKQVDLGIGGLGFIHDDIYCYNEYPSIDGCGQNYILDVDAIKNRIIDVKSHKQILNNIYRKNLPSTICMDESMCGWRFNILSDNKNIILDSLFNAGLFAGSHYVSHSQSCINAVNLQKKIINLFNDFYYTEEQALKTCSIINKCLKICNL